MKLLVAWLVLGATLLVGADASTPDQATLDAITKDFRAKMSAAKIPEAEKLARDLLSGEEKAGRSESPAVQAALEFLLDILCASGQKLNPETEAIGARALALRDKLQGPGSPEKAQTLHLIAVTRIIAGEVSSARHFIEDALAIYRKLETDRADLLDRRKTSQMAATWADAAGIFASMQDWNHASYAMQKSIDIRDRLGQSSSAAYAVALKNLATLEYHSGKLEQALALNGHARAILERSDGASDWFAADLTATDGRIQLALGLLGQAKTSLELAVQLHESKRGKDTVFECEALDDLAEVYRRTGDLNQARILAERSLAIQIRNAGANHPDVAAREGRLAVLLGETGDVDGAVSHALRFESVQRDYVTRSVYNIPEREAALLAVERSCCGLDLLITAAAGGQKVEHTRAAFDSLIRSRALLFDELAARRRVELSGISAEEQEGLAQLNAELRVSRERLAHLLLASNGSGEQTRQAVVERDRIEMALASKSARFRRELEGRNSGLEEVAASMPPGTALVSYAAFQRVGLGHTILKPEREYAAFVLVPERPPVVIPLGPAARIDKAIDLVRARILMEAAAPGQATKANEARYRTAASELRKLIWDPVSAQAASVKRVFLVPDGELNLINFAALPAASATNQYLVETGPVFHYLSAERDLATMKSLEALGKGLLAMGNPSFDRGLPEARLKPEEIAMRGARSSCSGLQQFAPLPGSSLEVDSIVRIWKETGKKNGEPVELTGEYADVSRFRELAPGRRTLHLAVHGFYLGDDCPDAARSENPLLLSGVALAGANRKPSLAHQGDGILTADEIASLDLRGVEWAVLSVCDSGLGKIGPGEGVFGLRRAFQLAGVHTVITSLWPIEDNDTQRWMRTLYEKRLIHHANSSDAVREASLAALNRRRAAGKGTHPFYWAAFVAAGDWR